MIHSVTSFLLLRYFHRYPLYQIGNLKADIREAKALLVQGLVVGDILCDEIIVIDGGCIVGDIECKSIFVGHGVEIKGKVNIHRLSPAIIDSNAHPEVLLDSRKHVCSGADGRFPMDSALSS